jgi:hypothetical protein
MIYPCDAITIPFLVNFNSNLVLLPATTTPRTILAVGLQQTGLNTAGQAQSVKADSVYLSFLGSGNFVNPMSYFSYKTNAQITAYNSSLTYNALGQLVYVDRDIALTPATCDFSSGEVVNGFFLFIILIGLFLSFIILNWIGIRIKRKA